MQETIKVLYNNMNSELHVEKVPLTSEMRLA